MDLPRTTRSSVPEGATGAVTGTPSARHSTHNSRTAGAITIDVVGQDDEVAFGYRLGDVGDVTETFDPGQIRQLDSRKTVLVGNRIAILEPAGAAAPAACWCLFRPAGDRKIRDASAPSWRRKRRAVGRLRDGDEFPLGMIGRKRLRISGSTEVKVMSTLAEWASRSALRKIARRPISIQFPGSQ